MRINTKKFYLSDFYLACSGTHLLRDGLVCRVEVEVEVKHEHLLGMKKQKGKLKLIIHDILGVPRKLKSLQYIKFSQT
jgi:hypothetical protein